MVVILMLILLIIKIISLPIDIWNWLSFLSLMLLTIELSHIGGNWSIEIRDSLRVAFHMGMVQRYTIIGIVAIIWLGLTLVFNRGAILRPFLVGVIWAMLFTSWMSDEVINSSTEYLPIYVWAVPSLVLPIAFAMMTWVFVPGRKGCEVSRLP